MAALRVVARLSGLASTLLLARLLTPSDFGLVALAFSVAQGIELLSVFGTEDAVIRHSSPNRAVYNAAFTLGLMRAIATAIIVAALAWPISLYFAEPRLAPVMLALAAATAISGCRNIGVVDFRRDLQYKFEFKLRVVPRLLSVAATLLVAVTIQSYWAIVIGTVTDRVAGLALSYWLHQFRPRLSQSAWRDITGFSLSIWAIGVVWMVRDRIATLVTGQVLGTRAVGILSIATEVSVVPLTELLIPLAGTLFPALSRMNGDLRATTDFYLRCLGAATLFALPAGIGLALVAEPVIFLMLGSKWLDTIPIVQLAAACAPFAAISFVTGALFYAHALMQTAFRISIIVTTLRVLLCIGLVQNLGLIGVVIAVVLTDALDQALSLWVACRRFHIPARAVLARLWRPVLGSLVMAAAILLIGPGHRAPETDTIALIVALLAAVTLGAMVFVGSVAALWLISGRPNGAETDLWTLARITLSGLRSRRRPDPRDAAW